MANVINGGTYDERNILGRSNLCILKCASFVLCFLILRLKIYSKVPEKHGLKSSLRAYSANSLKMNFFIFVVSIDKLVFMKNFFSTFLNSAA